MVCINMGISTWKSYKQRYVMIFGRMQKDPYIEFVIVQWQNLDLNYSIMAQK